MTRPKRAEVPKEPSSSNLFIASTAGMAKSNKILRTNSSQSTTTDTETTHNENNKRPRIYASDSESEDDYDTDFHGAGLIAPGKKVPFTHGKVGIWDRAIIVPTGVPNHFKITPRYPKMHAAMKAKDDKAEAQAKVEAAARDARERLALSSIARDCRQE